MLHLYLFISNICSANILRMRTSALKTSCFKLSGIKGVQLKMLSDSSFSRQRPPVVNIPIDKLDIQFARSSGAGGQNVNKLNTKGNYSPFLSVHWSLIVCDTRLNVTAEIRFNVSTCDWLPEDVKGRLQELQANRINKEGELVITSQEHR